jgi:hypothetical protein
MIRIAKEIDPQRLADLKKKIDDSNYLNLAIASIAYTLTKEIAEETEIVHA